MFRSVAAPGRAADPRPRQHGSGVEREGRSGFYFACSARYLAALAWASESPCLPAAWDASACFERSFAASIIPMSRAFCLSSVAFMAMGSAFAIASFAALTSDGQLNANAFPTARPAETSPTSPIVSTFMKCLLSKRVGPPDMTGHGENGLRWEKVPRPNPLGHTTL